VGTLLLWCDRAHTPQGESSQKRGVAFESKLARLRTKARARVGGDIYPYCLGGILDRGVNILKGIREGTHMEIFCFFKLPI